MNLFDYRIKKVSFTDELITIETADGKKAPCHSGIFRNCITQVTVLSNRMR